MMYSSEVFTDEDVIDSQQDIFSSRVPLLGLDSQSPTSSSDPSFSQQSTQAPDADSSITSPIIIDISSESDIEDCLVII